MTDLDIKSALPHGAITEIGEMSGVGYRTVRKVVDGDCINIKVMKSIGDYLERRKKEYDKEKQRIADFINH